MNPGSRASLATVVGAMGVVFGDIATSPLYTLQECLAGPHGVAPEPANLLLNIVNRFRTLRRTVLLTTVTTEEVPHVTGERAEVERLAEGLYRVVLRDEFMDEPHVHLALSDLIWNQSPQKRSRRVAFTATDRFWSSGKLRAPVSRPSL
jgi:K+ transporter